MIVLQTGCWHNFPTESIVFPMTPFYYGRKEGKRVSLARVVEEIDSVLPVEGI